MSKEKALESSNSKSGVVTVSTPEGYTIDLFVFSERDIEKVRPREKDYKVVAAMLANEKLVATNLKTPHRDRIRRILKK